jgi:hypothetical protein
MNEHPMTIHGPVVIHSVTEEKRVNAEAGSKSLPVLRPPSPARPACPIALPGPTQQLSHAVSPRLPNGVPPVQCQPRAAIAEVACLSQDVI